MNKCDKHITGFYTCGVVDINCIYYFCRQSSILCRLSLLIHWLCISPLFLNRYKDSQLSIYLELKPEFIVVIRFGLVISYCQLLIHGKYHIRTSSRVSCYVRNASIFARYSPRDVVVIMTAPRRPFMKTDSLIMV